MENVYLTGFMGSGKSTIGSLLASHLDAVFVDLDAEIEKRQHMPIAEIFMERGEAFFRDCETTLLRELTSKRRLVVALGGGAILRNENRALMAESGKLIYLRAQPLTLANRLESEVHRRPLLLGLTGAPLRTRITELLAQREGAYLQAEVTVDTDQLQPEGVVREIIGRLQP